MTVKIKNELTEMGYKSHHYSFSNVDGQPWFGRQFVEIPFGQLDQMIARKIKS